MQNFYHTLISVDQLATALGTSHAATGLVVVDCRFSLMNPDQGAQEYAEEHVEGAVYAHLDHDLAAPITPASGRHPLPAASVFSEKLKSWGIDANTQVVVYDHGPGAIAARLWWMLRWVGHHHVALLDGGFRAWREAEMPCSGGASAAVSSGDSETLTVNDPMWVTTEALQQQLREIVLTDARSMERYQGKSEPIDPVAGHIPGAISAAFEQNLGQDGRFLNPQQLKQRFQQLGVGAATDSQYQHVVHMCGSGVTACHNILAMEIAGMPGSRLYVGSWSEWIRDPQRPVVSESSDSV